MLYIWEIATSELIYGQKMPCPVAVLKWIEDFQENRRTAYELAIGYNNVLYKCVLSYDLGKKLVGSYGY